MKKFFLSLLVFVSLKSTATISPVPVINEVHVVKMAAASDTVPIDSSRISQTITLSENQHLYLIGSMTNIDNADAFNYIRQVKTAYNAADTSIAISVTVPSQLVASLYQTMTVKAEGVTAVYNNDIKSALMPQITNPWLGTQLMMIAIENARQLNLILSRGKSFIESIQ
jgi:uncharacterized protein YbaP (TraB family)